MIVMKAVENGQNDNALQRRGCRENLRLSVRLLESETCDPDVDKVIEVTKGVEVDVKARGAS